METTYKFDSYRVTDQKNTKYKLKTMKNLLISTLIAASTLISTITPAFADSWYEQTETPIIFKFSANQTGSVRKAHHIQLNNLTTKRGFAKSDATGEIYVTVEGKLNYTVDSGTVCMIQNQDDYGTIRQQNKHIKFALTLTDDYGSTFTKERTVEITSSHRQKKVNNLIFDFDGIPITVMKANVKTTFSCSAQGPFN